MRKVTVYLCNEPIMHYHSTSIPKVGEWIGSYIVSAVTYDQRTVTVSVKHPSILD